MVVNIAKLVICPLLEYERFSKVPVQSGLRKSNNDYQPKDFIRTVEVSAANENEHGHEHAVNEMIYKELPSKLNENRNDFPCWEIVHLKNSLLIHCCLLLDLSSMVSSTLNRTS